MQVSHIRLNPETVSQKITSSKWTSPIKRAKCLKITDSQSLHISMTQPAPLFVCYGLRRLIFNLCKLIWCLTKTRSPIWLSSITLSPFHTVDYRVEAITILKLVANDDRRHESRREMIILCGEGFRWSGLVIRMKLQEMLWSWMHCFNT